MEKYLPPKPSVSEVNKHLKGWKKLEKYTSQEKALNKLFLKLLPENLEISDILLKTSCLNDFIVQIYLLFIILQSIFWVLKI